MKTNMKRFWIATILAAGLAVSLEAQPKAVGGRIGATGFEVDYQHSIRKADFLEISTGLDFGYSGQAGFKATGVYNFTFARPAWTERGTWALYAGPGLSLGYVNDRAVNKIGNDRIRFNDYGFMLSFVAQVGLEYTFWFPLQLSLDLRPMFGMHVNDGVYARNGNIETRIYKSGVGYYDQGWWGFMPSLSVRYRF